MQPDLQAARTYVGLKQSTEAVKKGLAKCAYIALDADEHVRRPFEALCKEKGVPVQYAEKQSLEKPLESVFLQQLR